MTVDTLPPAADLRSPWKTRLAIASLATAFIALIWIVAVAQYLAGALVATSVALIVAVLVLGLLEDRDRFALEAASSKRRLLLAQMIGEMGEWSYDPARDLVRMSPGLSWMYGNCGRMETTLDEARRHIAPDARRRGDEAFKAVMATGEPQEYQRMGKLADGTQRVRRVIVYPTKDAEGTIIGFHGIDQDMTTAKRLEVLESRIAGLARLDAMHLMAATLAHEISQPLTAAGNYLAATRKMIQRAGGAIDPKIDELARAGEAQVHNAGDIIQRARLMMLQRSERVPVTILDAWDKAIQLVETVSPDERIQSDSEIAPDAAVVLADPVQLGQVFANLVRNAVEAVKEGPARIGLATRTDDMGFVRFAIRDNGRGLSATEGDIFMLAPTKGTGLGLGLLISRTIVESYGGKIWVDATGPDGTVIAFTLPTHAS